MIARAMPIAAWSRSCALQRGRERRRRWRLGTRTWTSTVRKPTRTRTYRCRTKRKKRNSELDLAALMNEAAALGALNKNQHLQAKLTKKHCLDAVDFIRIVEEGMRNVQKLLASTNKLEVLEAMELFRVTYEYKFDAAQAGIKKMLHLI